MHRLAPALVLVLACQAQEQSTRPDAAPDLLRSGTWVDLSHDFSQETIYWPTAKPFSLEVVSAEVTPGGYYYASNNYSASEHGGTHLDAPIHFAEGRHTTDQVPLEHLIGPAVVVDVTGEADADADYRIDRAALEAVGAGPRTDSGPLHRPDPHRVVEPLARQAAIPRHDEDRAGQAWPNCISPASTRRPRAGSRARGG